MKHLLTIFVFTGLAFTASAKNLCRDSASKSQARNALQTVRIHAQQDDQESFTSGSGFGVCNPTSFRAAPLSHIEFPNICGATFNFSDQKSEDDFIKWIKAAGLSEDITSKICVGISSIVPHPSVSAGN